jgi:xanthine dehydrogenase accessory factor
MQPDIFDEVQRLRAERRPFALATVVAASQPTSGMPGDRAIVLPDGTIAGWIGGHCAQPTVVRQALEALADGTPRLVILSPDAQHLATVAPVGGQGGGMPAHVEGSEAIAARAGEQGKATATYREGRAAVMTRAGVIPVAMTCAGQGELQIFVEPFLPRIELVVVGSSPVARTLAGLGALLDFAVWVCDPAAGMEAFPTADRLVPGLEVLGSQLTVRNYVIVATIGDYDEEALQVALASPASYIGLVASQKRLAAILAYLRERGVADDQLSRIKRPQGLPARARLPAEIAFSVMAELLEVRRQRVGLLPAEAPAPRAEAIDPICGMTVDIATARYTSERDGRVYYFCCAECQARFEAL